MSYHIYTTEGIILKRVSFGEANIVLHILTSDFGLIIASAQAGRLQSSKLRPALQEYTLVSVSCVKGKNGWKVTNAVEKGNFYFDLPEYSRRVLCQISSVLLQMIQGETPHPEIFQTVKTGFEFLGTLSEKDVGNFEVLTVLRILYQLGYVAKDETTETILKDMNVWDEKLLQAVSENKIYIVAQVNKALQESHL